MGFEVSSEFEPVEGLLGGICLGVSTTLFLLSLGRVSGMSGFFSRTIFTFTGHKEVAPIHIIYFSTMILMGSFLNPSPEKIPDLEFLLPGAFLVGFGTRMGCGCTSGHGISGLMRFSLRSFSGMMCFFIMGLICATSIHNTTHWSNPMKISFPIFITIVAIISILFSYGIGKHLSIEMNNGKTAFKCLQQILSTIACSALFSYGLFLCKMVYPSKVLGFLDLRLIPENTWDPTLIFVLGGAVIVATFGFQVIKSYCVNEKPFFMDAYDLPKKTELDHQLHIGAAIFGIGWGVSGVCPGPAMVSMTSSYQFVLYILISALGMVCSKLVENYIKNLQNNPEEVRAEANEMKKRK